MLVQGPPAAALQVPGSTPPVKSYGLLPTGAGCSVSSLGYQPVLRRISFPYIFLRQF